MAKERGGAQQQLIALQEQHKMLAAQYDAAAADAAAANGTACSVRAELEDIRAKHAAVHAELHAVQQSAEAAEAAGNAACKRLVQRVADSQRCASPSGCPCLLEGLESTNLAQVPFRDMHKASHLMKSC